jgi:hypothetical protein
LGGRFSRPNTHLDGDVAQGSRRLGFHLIELVMG